MQNEARLTRYTLILSMFYVSILLVSGALAYKIVQLKIPFINFDFQTSAAIFIFPLSYNILDVISERYSYKISRIVIWFGILCVYFFAVSSYLLLKLPSPLDWHYQPSYEYVLGSYFRLTIAGSVSMFVGEFFNTYAITKWKILLKGRFFIFRSISASAVGLGLDTVCEYIIGYTGVVPTVSVFKLMLAGYIIKVIYTSIAALPAGILVRFLKQKEKFDAYDRNTNFSPFILNFKEIDGIR